MQTKTILRIRPFTVKEFYQNENNVIQQLDQQTLQIINEQKNKEQQFQTDYIYNETETTQQIFDDQIKELINKTVENGINSTIFATGQTNSGKSYTISSQDNSIVWLTCKELNKYKQQNQDIKMQFQMLEIYNEQLRDLLDSTEKKVFIREVNNENQIINASIYDIENFYDLQQQIKFGLATASYASTDMNERSSRSHTLFIFTFFNQTTDVKSQLFIVDLAGSERISNSTNDSNRLRESNKINLSLQVLSLCIRELSQQKQHIPYRSSILTRVLQQSLSGNSLLLIIGCLSPASSNQGESASTCSFLQQAHKIVNRPVIQKQTKPSKDAEALRQKLAQLEQQILQLKQADSQPDQNKIINLNNPIFDDFMDMEDIDKIRIFNQQSTSEKQSMQQSLQKLKELQKYVTEIQTLIQQQSSEDAQIMSQQIKEKEEKYNTLLEQNRDLKQKIQDMKLQSENFNIDKQIQIENDQFNQQFNDLITEFDNLQKQQKVDQQIVDQFIPKNEQIFIQKQEKFDNEVDYCKNLMKQCRKLKPEFMFGNIPMTNKQIQKQIEYKQKVQKMFQKEDKSIKKFGEESEIEISNSE